MASRRRSAFGISRSVAASLAALLLLTGGLFIVSTLEEDHQEWVLVEDQVLDEGGIQHSYAGFGTDSTAEYTFAFDEETATYTYELTGGTRSTSSKVTLYAFCPVDGFDFSKNYKLAVTSGNSFVDFTFYSEGSGSNDYTTLFTLKSVPSDDEGFYTASVVLLDQYITDLEYKTGFYMHSPDVSASTTYGENTFTLQLYELQTDNTGSTAAGILGIVLIIMAVLATPAHNIFRRR